MCIISERVSSTLLAVYGPCPGAPSGQPVLEPVVTSALSEFDCAHELRHQGPLLSGLRCWAELVDGVIMNKKWQIHEKCSCVHPEIWDSAFMSSAISSAFSHGRGRRLGGWHFFFFSAVSECCGSSAAIRTRRQHLCLRLTAALSPSGTRDVCGSFAASDISLLSRLWRFSEFRRSRWKPVTAMKQVRRREAELWTGCERTFLLWLLQDFCCNIWYNLSTWMSLFPPFLEFLPFLAFRGLLIDFWWKFPILKYPATCYHDSRHLSWDKAHFAESSPHIVLKKNLPTVPPISPGYHNNLVTNDQK